MSSMFKFLFRFLLLLLVLLLIAVIAVPMFLDPNDYKQQMITEFRQQTGRELLIDGDLDLRLFPWLGLETGAMTIGNADGFGDEPFATLAGSEIAVKVLPLFKGRLETGTITLKGLQLNLARDAKGRGNWEGLSSIEDQAAPSIETSGHSVDRSGDGKDVDTPLEIDIAGVVIEDARLRWTDAVSGQQLFFDDIDVDIGALQAGRPVDVHLDTGIESSAPRLAGELIVDTTVLLDADTMRLTGLKLSLRLKGDGLPGGVLNADLQADVLRDAAAQMLSLESFKLVLNQSHIDGSVDMKGTDEPAIRFVLAVDQLDLDAWLPATVDAGPVATKPGAAAEGSTHPPAEGAGAGSDPAAELPLDTLRGLDLAGSLSIAKLKVANLQLQDVAAKLVAKGGVLQLSPLSAALYAGSFAGGAGLDARGDTLKTSLNWKLSGVQLGPLLADLNGEQSLSGTVKSEVKLRLSGNDPLAMKNSITGTSAMALTDGAYHGIDLLYELRRARAVIKGKQLPPQGRAVTDFAALSGSFAISNGLFKTSDLRVKSPVLRVKGGGSIDLPGDSLNLDLDVKLTGTLEGQGGKDLDELKGYQIPVTLTGSLSDPTVGVNLEKLLKGELGRQLNRQIDKRLGGILGTQQGSDDAGGGEPDGATDSLKKAIPGVFKGLFK